MDENCPFCRADIGSVTLWESEHYRVIADEFPVCAGHVLLLTKEHFASHVHAPIEYMEEFENAQERVRQFLLDTFRKASFFENGAKRQSVPHAHLWGLPVHFGIPQDWLKQGQVFSVANWQDVRREREATGYYFYVENDDGRFRIPEPAYEFVLDNWRLQLTQQTEAQIDPSGRMKRFGAEVVTQTVKLWRQWSTNRGGITGT
jgi:diadenosine tetraphosphate (Ap4A) HIT family hydrolase